MVSIGAMIRREVPPGALVEHVRQIKGSFDELWVVEDLPFAGGISQATAVLATTDDVVVGHGIAPAPFRNPAALAMEWATLAALYPGRVAAGIGHGVQAWMQQIGEKVDSPLTLLAETIEAVRSLLAGELVSMQGRYVRLDQVRLEFPPDNVPLVSAGVTGPKSLRVSGAFADGTILSEGNGPAEIERARTLIDQGRADAGRTDHHRLTVFAGFYAGDLAKLGPPPPDAAIGWDAIAHEPNDAANRLQTLIDAGADAVILVPLGADPAGQLRLASTGIVPQLTT